LAFLVQPSNAAVRSPIAPPVRVGAQDTLGNTLAWFTGNVTVTLSANPGGARLLGTTTRSAVNGVAVFDGLSIDKPAAGYRLAASADSLATAASASFDITTAAAARLDLVAGDGQTDTVGATLAAPYVVRVTDASGNRVSGVTVTWAVSGGEGAMAPNAVVTNNDGEARATHTLGTTVGPQTATAAVSGLAGSPVMFTAAATPARPTQLRFTVQPTETEAGSGITPAPQVAVQDRLGNTVTSHAGTVTVAIATNPGGGTLSGTRTVTTVNGVAIFNGLSIDKAASGYRLRASADGLSDATSASFATTPSAPAAITSVSGDGQVDTVTATLADPYVVRLTDRFGNPVPGVTVTWKVTGGGGSVSLTNGTTNASGRATTTHTFGTTAGAQTVTATTPGLSGSPVTFTSTARPGAAARLVYTRQPSNAPANKVITPPILVTVHDRFGNVVFNYTGPVTVAIVSGTGTPLAKLYGTVTRTPGDGTATFDDLRIDLPGSQYRLRATAGSLTVDSAPFDIVLE
jgi:hypothetical protein